VRGCGPARPVEDCAATARCLSWVQSCSDSPTADEVDEMAQASPTTSDRPSSVRLQVPPASARARSAQSIKGYPEHPFIPSFCRRISAHASCAGRRCSMAATAGRRLPLLPGACATPCYYAAASSLAWPACATQTGEMVSLSHCLPAIAGASNDAATYAVRQLPADSAHPRRHSRLCTRVRTALRCAAVPTGFAVNLDCLGILLF
jgi:hypothetical protein